MLSPKAVIPECCIDSCLFNVLLNFGKLGVNHTKGNGTVIEKIKNKFQNQYCLAIIDQDKRNLKYLDEECEQIEIDEMDSYFKLFKVTGKHNYIIQIVPEIERWIMKIVGDLNINLSDFGIIASNPVELARITKKIASKEDPAFKALFKEIIRKSEELNFEPVLKLQRIAMLILQGNYNLTENELKNA